MLKLLLSKLVVEVKLPRLLRELSEVVLRVIKLSFLTEAVDKVGETNENTSKLNLIRFSPEGFLEVVKILRILYVHRDFSFKISKYL